MYYITLPLWETQEQIRESRKICSLVATSLLPTLRFPKRIPHIRGFFSATNCELRSKCFHFSGLSMKHGTFDIHLPKRTSTPRRFSILSEQKVLLTEKLTHLIEKLYRNRRNVQTVECCVRKVCVHLVFGITLCQCGRESAAENRIEETMCWFRLTHFTSDIKLHK